jgi:hypothetical protein
MELRVLESIHLEEVFLMVLRFLMEVDAFKISHLDCKLGSELQHLLALGVSDRS